MEEEAVDEIILHDRQSSNQIDMVDMQLYKIKIKMSTQFSNNTVIDSNRKQMRSKRTPAVLHGAKFPT